ncbi:hypothetical protein MesoLj113b_36410 [Mesorhizobium sp. 113-3-3]|nr:hypothetical protein MesoLj113b_36410 [Mesorhizobium sp. 113-3-3]
MALPTVAQIQPDGTFIGTKALLVKLGAKAVLQIGWKLDTADEQTGIVTFTTGMSMGSWSGISGSIYMEDLGGNRFRPRGSAKQNVRGAQLIAPNLFNEAQSKVDKILERMKAIALAHDRLSAPDVLADRSDAKVRASGTIKDVSWTYFDDDFYIGERGSQRKRFANIDDLKAFFGL